MVQGEVGNAISQVCVTYTRTPSSWRGRLFFALNARYLAAGDTLRTARSSRYSAPHDSNLSVHFRSNNPIQAQIGRETAPNSSKRSTSPLLRSLLAEFRGGKTLPASCGSLCLSSRSRSTLQASWVALAHFQSTGKHPHAAPSQVGRVWQS